MHHCLCNAGSVRVYGWSGAAWVQLGGDINGAQPDMRSGFAVSLSADGTRVAVGAPQSGANDDDANDASCYSTEEAEPPANQYSYFDTHTTMCSDGCPCCFTSDGNCDTSKDACVCNGGKVRVLEYGEGGWVQLGGTIDHPLVQRQHVVGDMP